MTKRKVSGTKIEYEKIQVDERLLAFLPFYKKMWSQKHPSIARETDDREVKEALLCSLEKAGHAKRTEGTDGQVWLKPTDDYLRYLSE